MGKKIGGPRYIVIDTETDLIGQPDVLPQLVCMSWMEIGRDVSMLHGSDPKGLETILKLLKTWLTDDNVVLVFHNAGFDLGVLLVQFPEIITAVFEKLEAGKITDTGIREKLLNLTTHGNLLGMKRPDGSSKKLDYRLSDLVLKYTGTDITANKVGDDIWRLNYYTLLGVPVDEYPADAVAYAEDDAMWTAKVFEAQQRVVQNEGPGVASVHTAELRTAIMFSFQLMTAWGLKIDQGKVEEIDAMLDHELSPEKLNLLIEHGFHTPATPEMPYKNGAKNPDGTPKMKKAQKAKLAKKKLQGYVEALCKEKGLPIKMTDPTDANPDGQVSLDKEVAANLAPIDPVMAQFKHRQVLNKLVTDFMPKLRIADTIHPQFGVLVESGRSSSSNSSLFPSCNGQQVDPRVRECFVARPGTVLVGCDYSAIELAAFGQTCYELFDHSIHRDLINDGKDLHSYLAAQLLTRLPLDPEFSSAIFDVNAEKDPMVAYEQFKRHEHNDTEFPGRPGITFADLYDKWRKFAKAPGFGLPGGMGVARFQEFCRKDYGVNVTEEEAKNIKEVWLATYPEAEQYFRWVKANLVDPCNVGEDKEGRPKQKFCYTSPLGMFRAGTDYCSAANGMGFQTRTAEGALIAKHQLVRECYDPMRESVLYGSHVVLFIHDEIITEVPIDNYRECADRIQKVMVDWMVQVAIPDVKVEAEPCAMLRWNKKAKPVFDDAGNLQIWTPPKKQ